MSRRFMHFKQSLAQEILLSFQKLLRWNQIPGPRNIVVISKARWNQTHWATSRNNHGPAHGTSIHLVEDKYHLSSPF